ncbi:MAG TPA: hypothetical protein VGL53_26750 [Bryobacteraceae bacterium]|jgi:hypothetical protein
MPKTCFSYSSGLRLLALTVIAMIFVERPLQAYADPGSGLLAWQLLGAIVLGALYHVRRLIARLKDFAASRSAVPPAEPAKAEHQKAGQGGTDDGLFLS